LEDRQVGAVRDNKGGIVADATAQDGFRELCHDAKQSIATIMLLASAGEAEVEDRDQVLRRFGQIARQTRWMASLLDDVLGTEDGLGLVDVAQELEQTVKIATAGFGGTLRLLASEPVHAVASPVRLRRALANLLHNAVRAAGDAGCIQVRVVDRGRNVVVEVEDDGPGFGRIPTEHGIGLAATRRTVESFGGSLTTGASSLGGALVRVILPSVPSRPRSAAC
jgi:signal transduction histidine kinase